MSLVSRFYFLCLNGCAGRGKTNERNGIGGTLKDAE